MQERKTCCFNEKQENEDSNKNNQYTSCKGLNLEKLVLILILILVILSLVVVLSAQLGLVCPNAGSAKGVDSLGSFSLILSLSVIIPYLVTRAMTDKEIRANISESIAKEKKVIVAQVDSATSDINKLVENAKQDALITDSDNARMVSYLMLNSVSPDYLWSLSWAMRALINKVVLKEQSHTSYKYNLNDMQNSHCLSFIHYDMMRLYLLMKDDPQQWLRDYDNNQEKSYTHSNPNIANKSTICRVCRDLVYLSDVVLTDCGLSGEFYEQCKILAEWLILEFRDYLVPANKSEWFKYEALATATKYASPNASKKFVESMLRRSNYNVSDAMNKKIDEIVQHIEEYYPCFV